MEARKVHSLEVVGSSPTPAQQIQHYESKGIKKDKGVHRIHGHAV